jgi:hypothetical protein
MHCHRVYLTGGRINVAVTRCLHCTESRDACRKSIGCAPGKDCLRVTVGACHCACCADSDGARRSWLRLRWVVNRRLNNRRLYYWRLLNDRRIVVDNRILRRWLRVGSWLCDSARLRNRYRTLLHWSRLRYGAWLRDSYRSCARSGVARGWIVAWSGERRGLRSRLPLVRIGRSGSRRIWFPLVRVRGIPIGCIRLPLVRVNRVIRTTKGCVVTTKAGVSTAK